MSLRDPYRGRRHQSKKLQDILRQPSVQPDGRTPKGVALKAGIGDTHDAYLRGNAGGEAHPFFDNKPKSRR